MVLQPDTALLKASVTFFALLQNRQRTRSRLGFCDHYISAFSMSEMHSDRRATLTQLQDGRKRDEIIEWV